jgi:sugar lactone lactonase YvrE
VSALLLALLCILPLTGCGVGTTAAPDPVPLTVNGRVHGGQQAVSGAQIQLYAAGGAGNGSAATALLNSPVTSASDGSFSITGDYDCPSANSQVYLVATQGNPGLGSGGNNPALAMMAALGSCGNLSPSQFIWINEVTTAAAAWALAPFVQDIAHIGASSTNAAGLANAFLNAQLIANTTNGTTATLPSNLTTEPGKIYALADAMASCINSDGTTGCAPFLTAATVNGGSAPTNTWDAVINIVRNPGANVAGVWQAMGPQPPFATTLTNAPNDWTLSLTVTGGGLSNPKPLAIDSQGNVWAADYNGLLSAFGPQGTPLSASGYGSGTLGSDYGLTIDPSDNIWVTVEQAPEHFGSSTTFGSVVEFAGVSSGSTLGMSTVFSNWDINFPYAVAADSNGDIFIANYSVPASGLANTVVLDPSSNTYTQLPGNNEVDGPVALAADPNHGVWVSSTSDYSVTHIDASGNLLAAVDCCGPTSGVAVDGAGNAWIADYSDSDAAEDPGGSVSVIGPDGSVVQEFITAGGIDTPSGIFIDAAQNVWTANYNAPHGVHTESISELAGYTSSSMGAPISPATGYGLDANIVEPYALAVDPSGNVWVSNSGGNDLVMFFGLATPTKAPMPVTPQAP